MLLKTQNKKMPKKNKEIIWKPNEDFLNNSNIALLMKKNNLSNHSDLIEWSQKDPILFSKAILEDMEIQWYEEFEEVLDLSKGFPWAKWFVGGKINIVYNCIDKHLTQEKKNNHALIWEGDDGTKRTFTYEQLSFEVSKLANAMKEFDLEIGDTVGIFMPMIPETIFAMFACFKIGVIAVPIFSGFGYEAVAERLTHAKVKLVFTSNFGLRRGKEIAIKALLDKALKINNSVKKVVVFERTKSSYPISKNRDVKWHEFTFNKSSESETIPLDSEAISMIIYTSGTTGKPKGTIHTHAGCLTTITKEVKYCMDLRDNDILFWLTDIGWMMGPWEMIGTQVLGKTYLIYEGTPNWPNPDRLWQLISEHKITHLGISPTAIRLLINSGEKWTKKHDLSSLRVLASTGEPWDPESYMWYFEKIGNKRCPIMNISGGTEICGCLLQPYPIMELSKCSLGGPALGVHTNVYNEDGKPVRGEIGHLVCTKPMPSMTKSFLLDDERYLETYFSRFPNTWYHGDWAMVDEFDQWFLFGRSDDTINVAGKRVGPAEVESELIRHPSVIEAAVIGTPHPIKGEGLTCFVVIKKEYEMNDHLREELKDETTKYLGKSLRPETIKFVEGLPKTRSSKIVRGAIKKIYLGTNINEIDTSSIEDSSLLEAISRAK